MDCAPTPHPHFGQGTGGMKTLSRRELVCPGPSGEGGRREVREVVGQDPVRTVASSQSETGHVDGVTRILAAVWEVDPGGRGPMEEAVVSSGPEQWGWDPGGGRGRKRRVREATHLGTSTPAVCPSPLSFTGGKAGVSEGPISQTPAWARKGLPTS